MPEWKADGAKLMKTTREEEQSRARTKQHHAHRAHARAKGTHSRERKRERTGKKTKSSKQPSFCSHASNREGPRGGSGDTNPKARGDEEEQRPLNRSSRSRRQHERRLRT